MRILFIALMLIGLTGCGKWSQEGDGWWRESGRGGWYDESTGDWHKESGDPWYGSDHKETGNQCNIYGRCKD